jgi:transcriptional regulator
LLLEILKDPCLMTDEKLPLLQGTLDILVLKALAAEPLHGYAVARWIRETTDDVLHIEDGALYTSLHRLEKRGWLESDWGLSENNRRAKFYGLTGSGMHQLRRESRAWTRYADAVSKVLGMPEKGDGRHRPVPSGSRAIDPAAEAAR